MVRAVAVVPAVQALFQPIGEGGAVGGGHGRYTLQQQAMAEASERARQRDLVRIEMAERRIASGGYGFCEECDEEIPDGRLAIDPMATHCVRCAR